MDSRKASNNTLKSTNHQSDVDDIPGMLYKPVEVDRATTQQEVYIFIFICFCSFFEVRSAHISLQAYYLHERLTGVTSILRPWPRPRGGGGVLGRPSEAAYGYK